MRALLHLSRLSLNLVDDLRSDLRFALRSLRKNILLSVTVVITLGFGLGLNTGVFTQAPARCGTLPRGMTCVRHLERVLQLRFALRLCRAISFPCTGWTDLNWAGHFFQMSVP